MEKKLSTLGVKIDNQAKNNLHCLADKLGWSSSRLAAEIIREYIRDCDQDPLKIYNMIGLDLKNIKSK